MEIEKIKRKKKEREEEKNNKRELVSKFFLLHHYLTSHPGMDYADIVIRSCICKCDAK
jgi:hypothetical protein